MRATTASVHIQVPHGRNPTLQDPVNTAADDHRILENHLPGGFMVRGLKHQQATTTPGPIKSLMMKPAPGLPARASASDGAGAPRCG
jgi:hypothetical protein